MRYVEFNELKSLVGTEIGTSDWWDVSQERINTFADATGDFQWIHVDTERAKDSRFGSTIAHGYLTLSMLAGMRFKTYDVKGTSMGVNYGMNKVRFLNPVKAGSRIRAKYELINVNERKDAGLECTFRATVELEGAERPALIAETISVFYPE